VLTCSQSARRDPPRPSSLASAGVFASRTVSSYSVPANFWAFKGKNIKNDLPSEKNQNSSQQNDLQRPLLFFKTTYLEVVFSGRVFFAVNENSVVRKI
jgi:hypothetical protein